MKLAETVGVSRRFARSARVDADIGKAEALDGYVLQPSVRQAFITLAQSFQQAGQGAFTWTGPYGGGKSSAALVLAGLLGKSPAAQASAVALFDNDALEIVGACLPRTKRGWRVVALSGRRAALAEDIAQAFDLPNGDRLVSQIGVAALSKDADGLVIIIDELGKYLEHAALDGGDAHILQDLAELSARSQGRLLIVGILHQSFERYAAKLSRMARDEWAKIQGRFQDIPLASATDETLDLISKAITAKAPPVAAAPLASRVAHEVLQRRGSASPNLATTLEQCWPLHPVVALLLGQLARHRFGQNERSVFGFLGSAEPFGFQEFLGADEQPRGGVYDPAMLFDYLVANLGPAILASSEGHRFSTSLDAVDRAAARGGPLHIAVAKSAAVIELFGAGTGLIGSDLLLAACVPAMSEREVAGALEDLVAWSVLIHRRHQGAFVIYSGSDFDLDAAVSAERTQSGRADLADRLALPAIVAKRHYYRTGNLRWSDVAIYPLPEIELTVEASRGDRVAAFASAHIAAFAEWRGSRRKNPTLVLGVKPPEMSEAEAEAIAIALARRDEHASVTIGLPKSSYMIRELAAELDALERVARQNPQLEGDMIARREVAARVSEVGSALEQEVHRAFDRAKWYAHGTRAREYDGAPLSAIASAEADALFIETPLIRNELINRERPSSNAMAAVRALLHAMTNHRDVARLGLVNFPPEYALYATVLEQAGLHRIGKNDEWVFCAPDNSEVGRSYVPAWEAAQALPMDATIADLYVIWSKAPIGMRAGAMPLLAFAWMLANESSTAVYLDGYFVPVIDELVADRLLQTPEALTVRRIEMGREKDVLLNGLASILRQRGLVTAEASPLLVAKGLVRIVASLPKWTQRTRSIEANTRKLRDLLLHADDPHRLLFKDLTFLGKTPAARVEAVHAALLELDVGYHAMLDGLRRALAVALGCDIASFAGLQRRAAAVQGVSGDLRLDAFAQRVGTLEIGQDPYAEVEGLGSFLIHKPAQQWTDQDVDKAHAELVRFARCMREAEAMAVARGRSTGAEALSLVVAGRGGEPVVHSFDINADESIHAKALADDLMSRLDNIDYRVQFAALAEAFRRLELAQPGDCEAAE